MYQDLKLTITGNDLLREAQANRSPEPVFSLLRHPCFVESHVQWRDTLHILDFFAEYIPGVAPEGDSDRAALLLDVFEFAEDFAALIDIQQPVGLGQQFGEFRIRP